MEIKATKILVVKTGHTAPSIAAQYGTFNDRFLAGATMYSKSSSCPIEFTTYPICDYPPYPCLPLENFDGVTVTGSPAMVGDSDRWIKDTIALVTTCLDKEIPFLGICFGHQILGAATGSKVGPNSHGRYACTGTATVKKPDVLLEGVPEVFKTQLSHRDVILEPSQSVTVLGIAEHDPHHLIKVGKHAWGVQFHPEWNKDTAKAHALLREEKYVEEMGKEKYQKFLQGFDDTLEAPRILGNFIDYCARK